SDLLFFNEAVARTLATAKTPEELISDAMIEGIYNYTESKDNAEFRKALVASAYLYDLTKEEQYLDIASKLLNALPDIWNKFYQEWEDEQAPLISSGIIVRWNDIAHFTLGLGWRLMGTQRSPYQYAFDHN